MTVTGGSTRPNRGRRLGSRSCVRGVRGSSARGFRNRGNHDSGRVAVGVGVGDGLAVLAVPGASTSTGTTAAASTGCWCLGGRPCIPAAAAAAYSDGYGDCGWTRAAVSWAGQADGCGLGRNFWGRSSWWNVGGVAGGCLVGRGCQPGAVVGGAALGVNGSRAGLERRLGDGLSDGGDGARVAARDDGRCRLRMTSAIAIATGVGRLTASSACGKQSIGGRVVRGDGRVGESVMTRKGKRRACEGRDNEQRVHNHFEFLPL